MNLSLQLVRAAGLSLCVFAAEAAVGQCQAEWLPGYTYSASPLNGNVPALCSWQPPAGPAVLAVSSSFPVAGMAPVPVAVWDGVQWMPLPPGPGVRPAAIAVYQGELVVGGFASTSQGAHVARWNGVEWLSLGSGVNGPVRALTVHEGSLYAGGEFTTAGGIAVSGVARWDGEAWHDVGGGIGGFPLVQALHSAGPGRLIAGGSFLAIGNTAAQHIAEWDGTSWHAMGAGRPGSVAAITTYRGQVIAGGQAPAGQPTIAAWDGQGWQNLGTGLDQSVRALLVHDDLLYAGGFFSTAGGQPASRIASWDGEAWSGLGSGIVNTSFGGGYVESLAEFNGAVAAGGFFDTAGGQPSFNLARWGCPAAACYPNCDASTATPILNVADFGCFLQKFAAGDGYANCDQSTVPPVLNVADFGCFLTAFAAGCR